MVTLGGKVLKLGQQACKVRARALHCGLGLLLAWPGGRAWGLACGLSPKTRPALARAWARSGPSFKTLPRRVTIPARAWLGPGPAPALIETY
jgi:hypothetical protein